jgi:GNAT superfamily N-acetyltransferase
MIPVSASVSVLDDPEGAHFSQLYEIYAAALPQRERKARAEIAALVGRPDYLVLVYEDAGAVLGFSIVHLSEAAALGLLEYMATDETRRSEGLGAALFEASLAAAANRAILVEVDSDREAGATDRAIRIRRKNFYRRLGCRQIEGLDYRLPLPGKGAPPVMDLLIHSNGTTGPITREALRGWLSAVYRDVYARAPNDPRIDAMLRTVFDPITLV